MLKLRWKTNRPLRQPGIEFYALEGNRYMGVVDIAGLVNQKNSTAALCFVHGKVVIYPSVRLETTRLEACLVSRPRSKIKTHKRCSACRAKLFTRAIVEGGCVDDERA